MVMARLAKCFCARLLFFAVLPLTLPGCDPAATETSDSATPGSGEAQNPGMGLVGGMLLAPGDPLGAPPQGGAGAVAPAPQPQVNAPAQPQEPVIQPRRPADLVDKVQAMAANPDLVEVENHINASDPFSSAAQSYFALASRIHVLNLQHQLNLMKNLDENNQYPSFEEFKRLLEQSGVQLNGLRAGQVYAYDRQTGSICILEDRSARE